MEPTTFGDERGYFYEAWNERTFAALGIAARFVQDNQAGSPRGILRGLHYQIGKPQDKLVRCMQGSIYDVVVDVRHDSATFGRWYGVELSAGNRRLLWVPKGFAHGYLVQSERAEVHYKVTDYWSKEHERGICWNDSDIGITWPKIGFDPILNTRDAGFPILSKVATRDLLGLRS